MDTTILVAIIAAVTLGVLLLVVAILMLYVKRRKKRRRDTEYEILYKRGDSHRASRQSYGVEDEGSWFSKLCPTFSTKKSARTSPNLVKRADLQRGATANGGTPRGTPIHSNGLKDAADGSWVSQVFGFISASEDPDSVENLQQRTLGWLNYSLSYSPENRALEVRILAAKNLQAMDVGGTSDPYVLLTLLPEKVKLRTAAKHKTTNPTWNDTLIFHEVSADQVREKTLLFKVLDYDRFSRDDPIGEIVLPLENEIDEPQTHWRELQPCSSHKKCGTINVSLKYSLQGSSLTVTIIACHDLLPMDLGTGLSDPYVKVWFLMGGQKVLKKKTVVMERTLNPIFNERFEFKLQAHKIKDVSLLISVMDFDRLGRNDKIGGVLLGTRSGVAESAHWKEVFKNDNTPLEIRKLLRTGLHPPPDRHELSKSLKRLLKPPDIADSISQPVAISL